MADNEKQIAKVLRNDSGIAADYRHTSKRVTPWDPVETAGAILKWYAVHPDDQPVPDEIDGLARSFLDRTALEARGFGFVILHRCGNDFYFLIVNTWRGNNEIWETVYYKDGEAMPDFALWPRDAMHKPAYCVWELGPILHERGSWERFLTSIRDEEAAQAWFRDLYSGAA